MEQQKELGTVLWFSKVRGYGFIESDTVKDGQQLFAHWSKILTGEKGHRNLVTGQRVQFERKMEREGRLQALKIEILDGE